MTNKFTSTHIYFFCAAVLLGAVQTNSYASCNDAGSRLNGTATMTKIVIGYKPELPNFHDETNGYDAKAFSDPLPAELPTKDATTKLIEGDGIDVSYWEPDGKGQFRVCRIERWFPPRDDDNVESKEKWLSVTQRYAARFPVIVQLLPGHSLVSSTLIFYDAESRIQRLSEPDLEMPDFIVEDIGCRRYDQQHRLLLSIRPVATKRCPIGEPNPNDSWFEFKYGDVTNGVPEIVLHLRHSGRADGSWYEEWKPFIIGSNWNAPHGNAEVESRKGVMRIWGSTMGKRDDNVANTVLNSYGQSTGTTYVFTRPPVPIEVLQNPDALYKYERRRETIIEGSKLFELFPPNKHFSPHRYYRMEGLVLRHEQLNADGSIKRVITLQNYKQPRPGPRPAVDDRLLSQKGKAMHQTFHRVYEMDRNGKLQLVAMSWNEKRRFTSRDDVPVDYAHLVYGTPDGKKRWKTQADFEKAFETSSRAAHVFPDFKPYSEQLSEKN